MIMLELRSLLLSLLFISLWSLKASKPKVLVAGATGYIGRAVVSELVSRGIHVGALLRQDIENVPSTTRSYLEGAEIINCNVLDKEALQKCVMEYEPDTAICCLASRDGLGKNVWAIDYGGGSNLLQCLEALHADRIQKRAARNNRTPFGLFNLQKDEGVLPTKPPHYVLLSAYCCGKPELQFQYAKLKLEEELLVSSLCTIDFDDEGNIINSQACINSYDSASPLMKAAVSQATLQPKLSKKLPFPSATIRKSTVATATTTTENGNGDVESSSSGAGGGISHSIVRPTAYFKSLDGQVEAVRSGNPILYFGDGKCSANAISESDLAVFLSDCALRPKFIGMENTIRNVGGPDVPPITKKQQAQLIFDALDVPKEKRRSISLPLSIFEVLLNTFQAAGKVCRIVGFDNLAEKCDNGAEIVRIVKYYAVEPMVAIDVDKGEVQGNTKLIDHFKSIAKTGKLKEIDKYTTTTGVLDMIIKDDYVKT